MNASEYLQRNKSQSETLNQITDINRNLKSLKKDINELKEQLKKETFERKKQIQELSTYISKIEQAYGNGLIQIGGNLDLNSFGSSSSSNSIFDNL